jgi:hypothetical protein
MSAFSAQTKLNPIRFLHHRLDRAIAHSRSHCQGANITQASRKIFCGDSRITFNIADLFSWDRPRVCTTVWRKTSNCFDSFVIHAQQFWSPNHNPRSATKQRCQKHLIQNIKPKDSPHFPTIRPHPSSNAPATGNTFVLFWGLLGDCLLILN